MSLILNAAVLAALPGLAIGDAPAAVTVASQESSAPVVQERQPPPSSEPSGPVPPALRDLPTKKRLSPSESRVINADIGAIPDEDDDAEKEFSAAVFSNAAHFPLPEFGRHGERFAREAVVIYEGMTVSVDAHGKYELRFVVEAPKVPVTMRLQLHLQKDNAPIGTITVPPVTLKPSSDPNSRGPSESWLITHQGYAHQLRNLQTGDPFRYSIRRTGTARFGAVPE